MTAELTPDRVRTLDERSITVSPKEAAARLGCTPETLANWRWNGSGPSFVKVGGRVRYRLIDLADYLDRQMRRSTSEGGPHA